MICNVVLLVGQLWMSKGKGPEAIPEPHVRSSSFYKADGCTMESNANFKTWQGIAIPNQDRSSSSAKKPKLEKKIYKWKDLPCTCRIWGLWNKMNFAWSKGLNMRRDSYPTTFLDHCRLKVGWEEDGGHCLQEKGGALYANDHERSTTKTATSHYWRKQTETPNPLTIENGQQPKLQVDLLKQSTDMIHIYIC